MIRVIVQDENGVGISEGIDVPDIFPAANDRRFVVVGFIDPYGDTVFNSVQIPYLLREMEFLRNESSSSETKKYLGQLEALISPYLGERHVYVKFIGD